MIGYDKHRLNHQLVFDLPLDEYVAGATPPVYDRAKPHHVCTLHGGSWNILPSGLVYIDLSPNPDFIDCPAGDTADLDFTTENFSLAIWAYIDAPLATRTLICRGVANTDGWYLQVSNAGRVSLATCQLGATQATFSTACIDPATWYFIGVTRSEGNVLTYVNGLDVTDAADTHLDPTTANRELHIGVLDDEASNPWDGRLWRPRIWDDRVLAQWEWEQLFNLERHWF